MRVHHLVDGPHIQLTNEEKNGFCEIINMKIKRIFEVCGYKDYEVDKWFLNIR